MSFDLGTLFSTPALAALARHTDVPPSVARLMAAAAAHLFDSAMVVADPLTPFAIVAETRVRTPLPRPPVLHAVRALIDRIGEEGFGPHALHFFGLLGSIMVSLAGTPQQQERVRQWVDDGLTGAFCMTDKGGPLASQWRSTASADGGMSVDKIWAMNARAADFGIVVVRKGNSMILTPVLVPPHAYRDTHKQDTGLPFLDGHLLLGDVQGTLVAEPDWFLTQGGPISPKIFLALARPWLILALCAHVEWLARHSRVTLDARTGGHLEFLREAAANQARQDGFDRFTEDQAMALKWIANEVWVDLVVTGAVPAPRDQRDLLGFSKMEGSSYRCFFEIYERNKRIRHADA
ncbi:hypothetical protein ACT2FY_00755 [Paraburkholderia fungorum]|uniref:hypothetical protein n=1 Tax=Paraburkholderia fungorum TaxID=134537 RepID=UPI00402B77B4